MLSQSLTAHTRTHTPSEGQQCTSTLSCQQAQPNTAQPNTTLPGWRRGACGPHRGSAQTHAWGTGMPRPGHGHTHTYTHLHTPTHMHKESEPLAALGRTEPGQCPSAPADAHMVTAHASGARRALAPLLSHGRGATQARPCTNNRDTQRLHPGMLMTPQQGTGCRPLSHPSPGYI